ncbi:MAG TPA: hypothetical protein VF916_16200 [Ktedonobacterales bacterium]
MPRMSGQAVSVAANATSTNQLAGQLYEFLDRPAKVMLSATSSAAGINATLLIGGVAVLNDQPISQANRFPILPDDIVTSEKGMGRMILTFRNTTGGALTLNFAVDVAFR